MCRSGVVFKVVCAFLFAVVSLTGYCSAGSTQNLKTHEKPEISTCSILEVPKTRWPGFSDMVVDSSGTVWIMANNKVFCLDGDKFKEPELKGLRSGQYLTGLYGGPDRQAYATQRGSVDHQGDLYRLNKDTAELVTSFYYDVSHEYPGIYISKSGRIINWGKRFIATFNGKYWDRIEVSFGINRPGLLQGILDTGGDVYLYHMHKLYCVTKDGKIEKRKCPVIKGLDLYGTQAVLWGWQKALIINNGLKRLNAFDLVTGQIEDVTDGKGELGIQAIYRGYSLKSGNVLLRCSSSHRSGYSYFELTSDGELSLVNGLNGISNDRFVFGNNTDSVLETSNGELVFGQQQHGIAILSNGKLTKLDWKNGFVCPVYNVKEGLDGKIYFHAGGGIARLQIGKEPLELDPAMAKWKKYTITGNARRFVETKPGQLAMFRKDNPGYACRWDGTKWSFTKVPFNTAKISRVAGDARGNLLVGLYSHPDGYYDIGPDSVKRFDKTEDMFASAVVDGAGKFDYGIGYSGIVVTKDKRIWFGYGRYPGVSYFDGNDCDTFQFGKHIDHIFESSQGKVMFRSESGRFYSYDRGQMIEQPPALPDLSACMIGDNGLLPYDRKMYDKHPGKYYPVFITHGDRYLFTCPDRFEEFLENQGRQKLSQAYKLPRYTDRISTVNSGGCWLINHSNSNPTTRVFGDTVYQVSKSYTPIVKWQISDIAEDAAGGVWYCSYNSNDVFYCKRPDIELTHESKIDDYGRILQVDVSVGPESYAGQMRLFKRVNGGQWKGFVLKDGKCYFQFPDTGTYKCEITGLWMGSRIKKDISFQINADVVQPETIITTADQENIVVETFKWDAPIGVENPGKGTRLVIYWRVKGQEKWSAANGTEIDLSDLKKGENVLEFYAEEDGIWRDKSPVSLKIRFEADVEKIISKCLEKLISGNLQERDIAVRTILSLGEKGIPILEQRLKEAQEAARLIGHIRNMLSEMRSKQENIERSQTVPGTLHFRRTLPAERRGKISQ